MRIEEFISILERRDLRPRREGRDYRAVCPAHPDKGSRPSLTVSVGDDGRILLKCFSGCSVQAIVDALGLKMQDLFSSNGQTKRSVSTTRKTPARTYATIQEAGHAIAERLKGQFTQSWLYEDDRGRESFHVLRFDACETQDGEKTYRPVRPMGTGYIEGDPPGPLVLYNLPQLLGDKDNLVFVTEGEKACDAACSIGLLATCSAHGAKSVAKSDWTPLAGREVVILPDDDEAGRRYADNVAAMLLKLWPLPTVKVVELPGLPEKGDMVEFVQRYRQSGQDDAAIRQDLEIQIARTPPAREGDKLKVACVDPFMPFPLDALPEPVRSFVADGAKAIGCDPSFVAVPLLVGLASAIGNTRRIQLKRGWTEPAIIWAAIVADSGTLKSPALELALRAVRTRQHAAMQRYAEAMDRHKLEMTNYEKKFAVWKRDKDNDDPPVKPEEPVAEELWTTDATTEAVVAMLVNNPRGLLMAPDESATWLGGFDRYAQGRAGM